MTKQELIENYTMEQLADMVVELQEKMSTLNNENYLLKSKVKDLVDGAREIIYLVDSEDGNIKEYNILGELGEGTYFANGTGVTINDLRDFLNHKCVCWNRNEISNLKEQLDYKIIEIDKLNCKAENYRKAFEEAKKEKDCMVCEYQNKINGLENKTIDDFLPEEPIEVASMLINSEGEYEHNQIAKAFCGTDKGTYKLFDISELRQIAEHLLIYCNANESEGEE